MRIIILFYILSNVILIQAQNPTKILFVGNSITYYNDMPQTFESIANSLGDTTEVIVYAPGGTGFVHHVNNPSIYNYFRQKKWDYVILQPGSNESTGYSYPINETLERGKILIDSIRKYSPCSKILFHEISYGVWGNSASDLVTYNNTMSLIKSNLEFLADSTQLFFAPVGEVFRTKWNNDQNDILWGGYGDIHPNAKGSYIAACTFYSSIFQKPSHGTSVISSLSNMEADSIQQLCDSIVLNHLADWRINTFHSSAEFNVTINMDTVNFINLSQNIDSVYWDFGDGNYSLETNPVHVFDSIGNFNVTLTTYKNGCAKTKNHQVSIMMTNSNDIKNNENWRIYPNPTNSYLIIENNIDYQGARYEIYDTIGQLVMKSNESNIDVSSLHSGQYFIKKINGKTPQIKRFLKE